MRRGLSGDERQSRYDDGAHVARTAPRMARDEDRNRTRQDRSGRQGGSISRRPIYRFGSQRSAAKYRYLARNCTTPPSEVREAFPFDSVQGWKSRARAPLNPTTDSHLCPHTHEPQTSTAREPGSYSHPPTTCSDSLSTFIAFAPQQRLGPAVSNPSPRARTHARDTPPPPLHPSSHPQRCPP